MVSPIDPAEVMRCHNQHGEAGCFWTAHLWGGRCEPYRLAEALAASEAKVARVLDLAAEYDGPGECDVQQAADDIRAALADQ